MYSVVLLMALSGGAEAPTDYGCAGACYGGGCTGYVSSCSGSCHGGGHRLFGGHSSCHGGGGLFGGHSSCSGSCHGGGHRLFGGHGHSSCHGGSSCCGGGYCSGGYCSGGYMGCAGGAGCSGGMIYVNPPKPEPLPPPKGGGKEEVKVPATIVLTLPADAKVTIDGVATTSTSATRTFVTPELDQEKAFVYTLSAQIVRDGQTLTVSEKVTVRAGEETRVNFSNEKFTALTVATK